MKLLIIIILVAVAGVFGYRFLSKPKPSEPPAVETVESEPTSPVEPEVATKVPVRTNTVATKVVTNMAETAVAVQIPEWKMKLDGILASAATPEQKIQQLREFLSKLPDPDAEHAVQALTLSVKNEAFAFIKPLVVDPNLPEPVRDEFMVDLLNRPNSIRVPLFLELARNPDHPDHENAYDMLEIFTNQKLGADWVAWDKAVATWLKENPDQVRKRKAEPTAEPN